MRIFLTSVFIANSVNVKQTEMILLEKGGNLVSRLDLARLRDF